MSNHEKSYRNSTVRFDGFSAVAKKGGLTSTYAYGVMTNGGCLRQSKGPSYLSYDGTDITLPQGETLIGMVMIPALTERGRLLLPIIKTKRGVWCYDPGLRAFKSFLSAGEGGRLLNLPMPSGDVMAGIVITVSFWTHGILNWLKKGCDGNFTGVACVYANRLFVVDNDNKLLYSAPYDYANIKDSADEGGKIVLADPISPFKQLISTTKSLYAMTRSTIYRLEGQGAARDFSLKKLPYEGGAIIAGSAAACGDKLIFMTADGLYSVQEDKITHLPYQLPTQKLSADGVAEAVVSGGTYYFPCEVDGEKRTLCVDIEEGGYGYMQHAPVLCTYDGEVYGMEGSGRFFTLRSGCPIPNATFEKKGENFGDKRDKTLKALRLYGDGEVTISVSGRNGCVEKTLTLHTTGELPVAIKGKTFDVKISPKVNCVITALEADVVQLG